MNQVYEIVKIKQETKIYEGLAPLDTSSSYSVARWLQEEIGHDTQENLVVLYLDTRNNLLCFSKVFKGTMNQSIAHPRDIFQRACLSNAKHIIVAHNHPSNDSTPSIADNKFTNRIVECGKLLDIPLVDHIIVGQTTYYSYREQGFWDLLKEVSAF